MSDDERLKRFGDKRKGGNPNWKPGVSGNPGGKPSIWKDLEAANALDPNCPSSPPEARARWWKIIQQVACAGPLSEKDANWRYAMQEMGNRLMGKPREHVVIENTETAKEPEIDWSAVPLDRRRQLLDAMKEITELAATGAADESVEH